MKELRDEGRDQQKGRYHKATDKEGHRRCRRKERTRKMKRQSKQRRREGESEQDDQNPPKKINSMTARGGEKIVGEFENELWRWTPTKSA